MMSAEKRNSFVEELTGLAIDRLMQLPIGEKISRAAEVIQKIVQNGFALYQKQNELGETAIKAVTVITFSILRKIAEGKNPGDFDKGDWKEVLDTVSKYAVLIPDEEYSVFVFALYERYIRGSIECIAENVSDTTVKAISALADEIRENIRLFQGKEISEVSFIDNCLWICLEAMMKLLVATTVLVGDKEIEEYSQAVAALAFEYGRMMLYSKELEIVNRYIEYSGSL